MEVQRYLKKRIDVNEGYVPSCGLKGNALFTAVIRDHRIIVKMLLASGADRKFTLHNGYTDISWGWVARTPLQIAQEMNNEAMVDILQANRKDKERVRIIQRPGQYMAFKARPNDFQPVKGGLYYDYRKKKYRHAVACPMEKF